MYLQENSKGRNLEHALDLCFFLDPFSLSELPSHLVSQAAVPCVGVAGRTAGVGTRRSEAEVPVTLNVLASRKGRCSFQATIMLALV